MKKGGLALFIAALFLGAAAIVCIAVSIAFKAGNNAFLIVGLVCSAISLLLNFILNFKGRRKKDRF